MLQDVVIKVTVVVDKVDQLINTWWRLGSAALHRLWAHDLPIVDNQLLVERRWPGKYPAGIASTCSRTVFLHLHSQSRISLLNEIQ